MRRANASEISSAMHELGALQRHTGGLRQQLLANNAELQAVGAAFAERLQEVQEVTAMQQGVANARQVRGRGVAGNAGTASAFPSCGYACGMAAADSSDGANSTHASTPRPAHDTGCGRCAGGAAPLRPRRAAHREQAAVQGIQGERIVFAGVRAVVGHAVLPVLVLVLAGAERLPQHR